MLMAAAHSVDGYTVHQHLDTGPIEINTDELNSSGIR